MVLRQIDSGEDVFANLNEPLEEMKDETTYICHPMLTSMETDLQVKRESAKKGTCVKTIKKSLFPAITLVTLNDPFTENVVEARDIDAAIILSGFCMSLVKSI